MTLRALHEQRATAVAAMRALTAAPAGDGDLTPEQASEFDRHKAVVEGLDVRIARQTFVDEADRRAPGTPIDGSGDAKLDAELRQFSLVRAIACQVPDLVGVDAGREREISAELQRRSGRSHQGLTVPLQVFEQRVQSAGDATAGGFLVADTYRGDLFVDTLRKKLVTARLGATVLNGLMGRVTIPRRTSSATAQWVGENQSVDLSDAGFGSLAMMPKTIAARTEMTRDLLMQSSPSIETLVRSDFASIVAEAIDSAAINGSGAGPVPTGLLNTPNIGSFNLATVSWANVLAAVEDIETANAESTGWATNPHVVKVLRSTVKVSGDTTGNFIMPEPGSLAGYPLLSSNIIPATISTNKSALIFGNWSDLLIGYWGSFDLLVNPYESTAYAKGNVQVRVMQSCDVQVRHPESFTAAVDIA
ncbi:MAG: phage major capsid protein [Geminicoccaceae bacterium]